MKFYIFTPVPDVINYQSLESGKRTARHDCRPLCREESKSPAPDLNGVPAHKLGNNWDEVQVFPALRVWLTLFLIMLVGFFQG
jgi:hypothetical protein